MTKNYEEINNNLKNSLNYINKLKQNEINEEEKRLLIRNISNIINDSRNCIIKTDNNIQITKKQIKIENINLIIQIINKFNLFNYIDSRGIANFVNGLSQLDYKKTDLKYIDKKTKKEVELDINSLVGHINTEIETFNSQSIANTLNGLTKLFLYESKNIKNNYEQLKDVINNLINKFIEKIQEEIQQNQGQKQNNQEDNRYITTDNRKNSQKPVIDIQQKIKIEEKIKTNKNVIYSQEYKKDKTKTTSNTFVQSYFGTKQKKYSFTDQPIL